MRVSVTPRSCLPVRHHRCSPSMTRSCVTTVSPFSRAGAGVTRVLLHCACSPVLGVSACASLGELLQRTTSRGRLVSRKRCLTRRRPWPTSRSSACSTPCSSNAWAQASSCALYAAPPCRLPLHKGRTRGGNAHPPPRAAVPCRCGCGAPCRHVDQVRERLQAAAEGLPQPGWEPIEEPATPELPGDKLGPRMVLYSAHDTTLAAVLSALGLFDGCVDPAAVWCR